MKNCNLRNTITEKKRELFGTDGIRGEANKYPLIPEIALKLGKALAKIVRNVKRNETNSKIIIGKDTRLSGYMLETALVSGIVSMGVDVCLVGPMPTPAIAHLTRSMKADAGIMITASHNPAKDNGIKIFDSEGFKLPDEIELEIEKLMFSQELANYAVNSDKIGKAFRIDEAKGRYIEFAKSTVKDFSLKNIKLVLDCANGAAYDVAPKVFKELGAEVIVLNNNPDGHNINKDCGAIHPEKTAQKVMELGANIGITLDGDSDRIIICDEKGEIIDGDYILAFCALQMIKNKELNQNTLVVTSYSNLAVDSKIKENNGNVIRTENGDRYVIQEMRLNKYNLGGESSGHIIFSDYVTTGDGVISGLQILKMISQAKIKTSEIKNIFDKNPQYLCSCNIKEKKDFAKMPKVILKIQEIEKQLSKDGRLLIRYSGTENKCRIMIEGKNQEEIEKMCNELLFLIKEEN
jgi:phosphoglucosamine mutase